jgi:hypothetical protein
MYPTTLISPAVSYSHNLKRNLQEAKDSVVEFIKDKATDSLQEKPMYLYLIDEYTGDPVVPKEGGAYPIEITQPSQNAVKLLPLMRGGLKVMSIVNGAAFVGHMFGVPIPSVPKAWQEKANNAVGSLDQKSSVAEFDVLQETLDSENETKAEGKDKQAVRGAALREFKQFLAEKDPGNTFCGLNRVVTDDGKACWTSLDQTELEAEEEARKSRMPNVEAAKQQLKQGDDGTVIETQIAELKALLAAGGGVAAVRNMQVCTMKPRLRLLLRRLHI